MNIKEKAKKLKSNNGNIKVTNGELLWYLVGEMDELKKELGNQKSKIAALSGISGLLIMLFVGIVIKVW